MSSAEKEWYKRKLAEAKSKLYSASDGSDRDAAIDILIEVLEDFIGDQPTEEP